VLMVGASLDLLKHFISLKVLAAMQFANF
jgi:hypothetical protein